MPEDEAHVWVADHRVDTEELESCIALLDPAERDRASRFRFQKDFRRFVVGHARVRSILGLYSAAPAAGLRIARRCATCGSEDHGKPSLLPSSGGQSKIRFSCSYSDQLVLVAVSNGAEIGVDVERVVAGFDWRQIAETALSPRERARLDALDGDAAVRAFFGIWTRKEAVSKVSARGLDQLTALDTCGWTYEGDEFEVFESSSEPSWVGTELEIPGHQGAVAIEGASSYKWSVRQYPAGPRSGEGGA
ncbi:MAG TPA: 4'-phosphopantetheinyl transferase superfamily protein [Actinomycetota bacterium]|nr:4'-phosphopantetheinyl transferase superfamily protein [Actinomycetota bacterium]